MLNVLHVSCVMQRRFSIWSPITALSVNEHYSREISAW